MGVIYSEHKNMNSSLYEMSTHSFSAKPVATRVKHLRLKRDDFETLNVIGRGAFGEVGHHGS